MTCGGNNFGPSPHGFRNASDLVARPSDPVEHRHSRCTTDAPHHNATDPQRAPDPTEGPVQPRGVQSPGDGGKVRAGTAALEGTLAADAVLAS